MIEVNGKLLAQGAPVTIAGRAIVPQELREYARVSRNAVVLENLSSHGTLQITSTQTPPNKLIVHTHEDGDIILPQSKSMIIRRPRVAVFVAIVGSGAMLRLANISINPGHPAVINTEQFDAYRLTNSLERMECWPFIVAAVSHEVLSRRIYPVETRVIWLGAPHILSRSGVFDIIQRSKFYKRSYSEDRTFYTQLDHAASHLSIQGTGKPLAVATRVLEEGWVTPSTVLRLFPFLAGRRPA